VLHVVNTAIVIEVTAREEIAKTGHFNERAANEKKSILRNLQQLMPEQGLTDSIKFTSGHDEYPSSSVEADPRTACIEKAAIQQHTSKIF
jgi:hypothetical protein